jgi:primosomal protein N' (replication factor Y)
MYIIEVIPIARSIGSDTLSYFTTKPVFLGDIVDVPVRNKTVHGIVISIKKAEDMKSEIKTAGFALKKIEKIKGTKFFTDYFMEMVKDTAEYYATSTGMIMNTLVPKYIIENVAKLKIEKTAKEIVTSSSDKKFAVQGDDEERLSTWKSTIRQEFAKKKSVLFVNPTVEDTEHSFKIIEKGIEGYAFILHGSLSPKTIIETWNKIIKEEHPVVIVATGGFLSIPRTDISTLILENESSRSYKIMRRPYLDIRNVCEIFAEKSGMKIFFADQVLRTETLYKETQGEIIQSSPFKSRSLSTATDTLVDMKKYKSPNSSFKILSDEVENLILKTKNNSESMIILATRRGVAPTTVCGDCQTIVTCNTCSSPVVLHRVNEGGKEKSFFMCHRCGERRSTEEYCKICGSWKLGTVGIGIDLVIEKIKSKFPDVNIFKIDADTTKITKTIKSTIEKFKSKPGSILVGTEMMLQYLHDKVENSAIISLDSLFALPDFRIQEKILQILIHIRALTTQNFIVQTRKSDEKVFEFGLKGNMNDFYKTTIEERRRFNYPPFTTLIKITLEGKKDEIVKEMENVQNILDPYEVEVFPAFTHTVRGNYVLHGLIRLPHDKWPNPDLNSKLRQLSPGIIVKVDPETLL